MKPPVMSFADVTRLLRRYYI